MTELENLRIIRNIYNNPKSSQRQLAEMLGYSLGKLNYSLKELKKKGLLKTKIFNKQTHTKNHIKYIITPEARSLYNITDKELNLNIDTNKFNRKKTFLIAEIGINHNGSVSNAKKLMKLVKENSFDAVKFQKRDLNVCIPESQKHIIRETPWGNISYLEYKKKIELNLFQYKKLSEYAKKIGIDMFVSCWDVNSVKQMKKFNFRYNKIASAMITNLDLLNAIAIEKKKTFISTGMCTMKDIERAVKIFKSNKCDFVLMHSVSLYPCDENLLNLNFIKTLKKRFKCEVGYSGHESSVSPTITAFFMGADYIERHVTLDRANWGTDQAASLAEEGIENLSSLIRKIPTTLGDGVKKYLKEEKQVSKKMRYWEKR
jgi:N-acetylneuraminate synthase